jgi:hypothetical protein
METAKTWNFFSTFAVHMRTAKRKPHGKGFLCRAHAHGKGCLCCPLVLL